MVFISYYLSLYMALKGDTFLYDHPQPYTPLLVYSAVFPYMVYDSNNLLVDDIIRSKEGPYIPVRFKETLLIYFLLCGSSHKEFNISGFISDISSKFTDISLIPHGIYFFHFHFCICFSFAVSDKILAKKSEIFYLPFIKPILRIPAADES